MVRNESLVYKQSKYCPGAHFAKPFDTLSSIFHRVNNSSTDMIDFN